MSARRANGPKAGEAATEGRQPRRAAPTKGQEVKLALPF